MPAVARFTWPRRLPGETNQAYAARVAPMRAAYEKAKAERKAELAQEKAAKTAKARTCQICGRAIFAETGVIAHHGYERPSIGWQTASCEGARHLPFERSRDVLGGHIEALKLRVESLTSAIALAQTEGAEIVVIWRPHRADRDESAMVTAATFDAWKAEHVDAARSHSLWTFEAARERHIRRLSHTREQTARYLEWQEGRYAAWTQTEGVEQ